METNPRPAQFQLEAEYPPPPRVHWVVLLVAAIAVNFVAKRLAPEPYWDIVSSLIVDGWAFYLCLWIKQLDPEASSPFWCDVYVVVELGFAATKIWQQPSSAQEILTGALEIASGILGIATVFLIRADLLKHYNQREPIGLSLGPVKTFFFSFLYFQSELYDIAQSKKRQAEGGIANPSRSLLP